MKIRLTDNGACLEGNWTINSIKMDRIDSLAGSLTDLDSVFRRTLQIDCSAVTAIDTTGLELLYVWMQCAKIRGFEPELINLPADVHSALRNLRPWNQTTDTSKKREHPKTAPRHTRRAHHENRRDQEHRQATKH
jgi:ABC-type transporter Mla MlaB component